MSKALKTVAPTPTPSISHWPTQKKIRLLAESLDDIVSAEADIAAAINKLASIPSDPALLEAAKREANFYNRGIRTEIASGDVSKLRKECIPTGWRDDEGEVQQPEIAMMVAKLVGSFPTSNIPDPKVFVRVLIEDVMACNPSFVVFDSACRKLRAELKFMPSIAEVMAEIESQNCTWRKRFSALDYIEYYYERLFKLIAESEVAVAAAEEERELQRAAEEQRKRERAAAEKERKYREAKAAPLIVGDRVRHRQVLEDGEITKPAGDGYWYMQFDNFRGELLVDAKSLEKLVEGDDGFVPLLV
jgi:hypothetical protein